MATKPIRIEGYESQRLLRVTDRTETYIARRVSDGKSVILKCRLAVLEDSDVARLSHEISVFQEVPVPGFLPPLELKTADRRIILASPKAEGIPSDIWAKDSGRNLDEVLLAAVDTIDILARIHRRGIVHGNIKPSNVLIDAAQLKTTLIDPDFYVLHREALRDLQSDYVSGRLLSYFSPEQTGRAGREVDHRSDLYSFGLFLYELLAEKPPFEEKDPISLIHAHLAAEPPPLSTIRPDIPEAISDITRKLLEKDPDKRYQSAKGVKFDLERCLKEWKTSRKISPFAVGGQDLSEKLHFSGKLYGREHEIQALKTAVEEACRGICSMLFLTGAPGAGKSSLAVVLSQLARSYGCKLISGAGERFRRDVPYFPFARMFERLLEQLLLEREEALAHWKSRFSQELGSLGRVIVEVCPELSKLLGDQPPLPDLPPPESRNRIELAITRFMSMLAQADQPLILFFDDLQWLDLASLDLLRTLTIECHNLPMLIIAAMRSSKGEELDRTALTIDSFRSPHMPVKIIAINPLSIDQIMDLLADTLSKTKDEVRPLAVSVHEKTDGNPLFARIFLRSLNSKGLLSCDPAIGWKWDNETIKKTRETLNVVQLLCDRVASMPATTDASLKSLVFAGGRASLELLSQISGENVPALLTALKPALDSGLVADREGEIVFVHDRVNEAVRVLIDDKTYASKRLFVGRLLQRHLSAEEQERRLFEIVDHLNSGCSEISANESIELASLNLKALHKAKRAAAFAISRDFCHQGILCLPDTAKQDEYQLWFSLHSELAELEFLNGNFSSAEQIVSQLLNVVSAPLDRAYTFSLLIQQYNMQARYQEAIDLGRTALKLVEVDFPLSDASSHSAKEFARSDALLNGRSADDLINSPAMTDPRYILASRILALLGPAIFVSRPDLFVIDSLLMVNLSLEHGHTAYSPAAYAAYGFVLAMTTKNYPKAYTFAAIGMRLADKSGDPIQQCRATHFAAFIHHYVAPLRETNKLFQKGFQAGVECGENEWAAIHAHFRAARAVIDGTNLSAGKKELERLRQFSSKAKNVHAVHLIDAVLFSLEALISQQPEECLAAARQKASVKILEWENKGSQFAVFLMRVLQAYISCLACNFEEAQTEIEKAFQLALYAPNHPYVEWAHFLKAVVALNTRRYNSFPPDLTAEREEYEHLKNLAETSPSNYLAKALMVAGELARVEGRFWDALQSYEKARQFSKSTGITADEALACELTMRFWLDQQQEDLANFYLHQAITLYQRWGCLLKVHLLRKEFGHRADELRAGYLGLGDMDFRSLLKSCQAIAQEINYPKLVTRLMEVLIENTGAQSGALFAVRDKQLTLVATAQSGRVDLFEWSPLSESDSFCAGIVRYASRIQERLIVRDATADERFSSDDYVEKHKPRSVLCAPIWLRDSLKGLIYLENRLSGGVFAADRFAVLDILLAQAGISLENAELFSKHKEAEQNYKEVFNAVSDAFIVHDADSGVVLDVNHSMLEMYECTYEEALHSGPDDFSAGVTPYSAKEAFEYLNKTITEGPQVFEWKSKTKSGREFWTEVSLRACQIGGKKRILTAIRDIGERKRLEEQLRQIQKMEAIGQLAGGLGHDFNNLLQGLLGFLDLALIQENINDYARECIQRASDAGQRAANLTKQLLAFSRKQLMQSLDLDINRLINKTLEIIRSVVGEHISLRFTAGENLAAVHADPGQLEQILLNLCINSRDAMPDGGAMEITTGNVSVGAELCQSNSWARPGPYVLLSVSDTGCGMDDVTRERIFEPFFTTKDVGRGTGLGMAMVYGIVQQHKGIINIESRRGHGTTVNIYLPAVTSAPAAAESGTPSPAKLVGGAETILIVEDEELVRDLARRVLESAGYNVLLAADGKEGLKLLAENSKKVDLVLLDMIMPKLGGKAVYQAMKEHGYRAKCLITSGYSDDFVKTDFISSSGLSILKKPYRIESLLQKVREVLERKDGQ